MQSKNVFCILTLVGSFVSSPTFFDLGSVAFAEETKLEKAEIAVDKAKDVTNEKIRDVKDETCTMVNGKMQCAEKKLEHKMKTAADKAKTKAKETKKKME